MAQEIEEHAYMVRCWMPGMASKHFFVIRARSPEHADVQARDGYFGLLAPPSAEVRASLIVEIERV